MKKKLAIAILAAGKGSRMNSEIPKVLHEINGTPMISQVINTSNLLDPEKIITIVGYKKDLLMDFLKNENTKFAIQKEQKGTAHAIMQCEEELKKFNGNLLILSGDVPLISKETLSSLIEIHQINNSKASLITTIFNNPYGYGRIIRSDNNQFVKIVEQKDANKDEAYVKEINSGIYLFDAKTLFEKICLIKNDNSQQEYYIGDLFNFLESKDISIYLTDIPLIYND